MTSRSTTQEKTDFARRLRKAAGRAEAALWALLRRRQVAGVKFRRRSPVLGWIPDFWCPEARVAVELDGFSSQGKAKRDAVRDGVFAEHGIRTVHVPARLLHDDPGLAVQIVQRAVRQQLRSGKLESELPSARLE
jgi:very-short-patch-repair endonuclease